MNTICTSASVVAIGIITLLMFVGAENSFGQNSRLADTLSPDKTIVIVKERKPGAGTRVFFVNAETNEKLGAVLSLFDEGDLGNVSIISSWNRSSSKIALLICYGVRSSKIKLFKRNNEGTFVPVELPLPDPLSIYGKRELKALSEEHVSASENSLGPWNAENSVRLISGVMIDRGNNEFVHLLVTFTAVINAKVDIKDVKLVGPYSDQEADRFLEEWGD